jgi:hypothetical protein
VVDDPDAVGEHVGLLEVLRGEEDRDAVVAGQPRDLVPQGAAALHVEAGGRLVEEEDARVVDERQREVEPPPHAARVAADAPAGGLGEAHAREQLVAALPSLGSVEAVERPLKVHVLAAGEVRVEGDVLERRADRGAHLGTLFDDVVAAHECAPRGRR